MAEEGNWKIQWSVKFGNNNMLNIRADSVEELMTLVNEASDQGAFLVGAAEDVQAKAVVAQQFPGTADVPFDGSKPTPAAPSGPVCAHKVPYKYNSGEKNGKKWAGWFCQVENDPALPKCKAKWDN